MLYDNTQYSGNLYVLSEGEYPNLTSMGCPPDYTIRSVKAVPTVRKHSDRKLLSILSSVLLWPSLCSCLDILSSFHLSVWPRVSGGQRDLHRNRDPQHGWRGLQQPHSLCPSQQRQVSVCPSLPMSGETVRPCTVCMFALHKFICIDGIIKSLFRFLYEHRLFIFFITVRLLKKTQICW